MSTNKRTYINADEELIIQGKLTIEGEIEQRQYTVENNYVQSNFEGEQLIVNSDGFDIYDNPTQATVTLRYGDAQGNLSVDANGNILIDGNITVTGNIDGVISGAVAQADRLTTPRAFSISGDASAPSVNFDGTQNVDLSVTLATISGVQGSYGTASTTPVITVDNKGRVTVATTQAISIPASSVTGLTSAIRSAVSATGDLSYNNSTGVFSYTERTDAQIRALVSAGGDLSYNSGTGVFSVTTYKSADFDTDFSNKTTNDLTEGTNLYYTDARFDSRFSTKTTSNLSEGTNLYYTQSRFDSAFGNKSTSNLSEGTNKYYTQGRFDSAFSNKSTTNLSEGTNKYYTDARARSAISATGDLSYNSTTGVISYTGRTDAEVRNLISVTDTGGDGSLSYNDSTGVITYTGPSASEVRAHFSGDDGIDITNGEVAVDSTVVRTSGTQSIAGTKTFTGTVDATGSTITVPTQAQSDSSTKAASTAYVRTAVSELIDNAPAALDTLNELAAAINDDESIGGIVSNNTTRIGTLESRNLNAGAGLTGGGNLGADRTFNVGAGTGIDVSADAVSVNTAHVRGLISATGNINYNSTTGVISESLTTDDIAEGTNLYYTDARFDSRLSTKSTSDLSEGTNLYYTQARFDSAFTAKSTADLSEDTNLYYTQARFDSAFTAKSTSNLSEGTNLYYTETRFNNAFATKDTDDLDQGTTNRYYASSLFNTDFASKSTSDLSEGTNLYYTDARARTSINNYLTGGSGVNYSAGTVSVDNTVVRTSGNQSIAGNKTFTGELIMPQNGIAPTNEGSLFHDGTDVFVALNGVNVKLTPQSDVGEVEDVGTGEADIYAGYRLVSVGNTSIRYHGVKSINSGTYTTLSESANVISIDGDISAIRSAFSGSDAGGLGSFGYNSTTGAFTYTGPSEATIRGLFSGTGLIGYNSSTGAISTTADNYSSWTVQTDSGAGTAEDITSGETLTFVGGTNISVTNTGNQITISSNDAGDISAVTAGAGLTGGGNTGAVTLNVGAGTGINVNANDIAVDMSAFDTDDLAEGTNQYFTEARARNSVSATGDISYNSTTGEFSYTEPTMYSDADARGALSAGGDLSYNSTTGEFSYTERTDAQIRGLVSAGGDLSYNSTTGEFSYTEPTMYSDADARSAIDAGGDLSYNSTTGVMSFTERTNAEVRGLIDAGGDLSYNSTTGVMSFTERTNAEVRSLIGAGGDLNYNSTTGVMSFTERTNAEVRGLLSGGTGITYNSSTGQISLTDTGYITGVTAGSGLTGGGASGTVTLNIGAGTGINVNANDIAVDIGDFSTSDLSEGTNLYHTTARARAALSAGTGVTYNSITGQFSIGQAVGTSSSVQFSSVTASSFVGTASSATQVNVTEENTNVSTQRIVFHGGNGTGNKALRHDDDLTYVPSTNTFTAGNIVANTKVTSSLYKVGTTLTLESDGTTSEITEAGTGAFWIKGSNLIMADSTGTNKYFTGIASTGEASLFYGGGQKLKTTSAGVTVTGDVSATNFNGVASSAKYADLAEKYATDADYEAGTVVVFGGDAEVTTSTKLENTAFAGVISTDPAYMMNSEADGQYVALRGRVPCKVIGTVKAGDVLVTSEVAGYAKASSSPHMVPAAAIVGKAIKGKTSEEPGVIEILV